MFIGGNNKYPFTIEAIYTLLVNYVVKVATTTEKIFMAERHCNVMCFLGKSWVMYKRIVLVVNAAQRQRQVN